MAPPPASNGSQGKNGASGPNGAGHHPVTPVTRREEDASDEPLATSPLEEPSGPPPPAVAELYAAAMRFVAQKYKVPLDGTLDTLSLVDQYVRDARGAIQERPETLELVVPALGAYFGEVLRQTFGGTWFAEGAHDGWRLYFRTVYLAFNPLGIIREALTMREEEGWHAHFALDPGERELVEERLAVIPEVDEEEYYLPTTRLDVVTVVVETLRAHAERSATGDVRFGPEDYD